MMRRSPLAMRCAIAFAAALIFSSPAWAQQKTSKQCNDEWAANKAEIQASGKKKKDFIAECRAGGTGAAAGTTQSPAATTAPAPSTAAKPSPATRPAATATPAAAGQFASEPQAKAHCPSDTVVWANLDSKIYHFSGTHSYGNTKKGAYMCEKDTAAAGFRAAKNEKHP